MQVSNDTEQVSNDLQTEQKKDVPFFVEVMPQYPGGDAEMSKFISQNLKYPTEAIENDISGRVVVSFIIGKDGNIVDAKISRGISPECDAEALRIIKSMPKWIPGKQKGENVAVHFSLMIAFKSTPKNQ